MQNWRRIFLWVVVAVLILSVMVCQKKTEKMKTSEGRKEAEISSGPEDKPAAAAEPKTTEPEKPAQAAPAKPEITRENAAAIIEMEKGGRIVIVFYPEDAPNTVDNFIKLANRKFYDGLDFHRVEPGLLVQGGRPEGWPPARIKAEFNSQKHVRGTVAMARADDPDSATSQFYICLRPLPVLDGKYTVFGQVIEGMEVVDGIQVGDVMKEVTIVDKATVERPATEKPAVEE